MPSANRDVDSAVEMVFERANSGSQGHAESEMRGSE